MRKLTATLFFLLPLLLSAQTYPWEFGGGVYITSYQGDLHTPEFNFGRYSPQAAAALHLRRNISNSFILRFNALFGQLAGDDSNFTEPEWRQTRDISFTSPIIELTALGELYPFGIFRFMSDGERRRVAPFLMFGVGAGYTNPKVAWNDENGNGEIDPIASQFDKSAQINKFNIVMSMGAGLRFALSTRATIGLEAALHPTFSDYVDGVSHVGNPDKSDWYFTGGLTFSYAFGKRREPGIIVSNEQLLKADDDRDGVPNVSDKCPDKAGPAKLGGCPDSDNDNVTDQKDKCPDQPGSPAFAGCPDSDYDGLPDKDDNCPTVPGEPELRGCPDTDSDGVADKDDICPTERGSVATKGCPDWDKDGVTDKDDACPQKSGSIDHKGCPDTDGDGIYDHEDNCPEIAGTMAVKGCPEIKAEDKAKLESAVKLVQFEAGEAKLLLQSYSTLNDIADLMTKYSGYGLLISGHTDSAGDDEANQSLSERRAQTCYLYLMRKEVPPSRMSHTGYGESRPVASNSTAAGRAQNRRVEFELYVK
jgi:outer membrane protein OmpA-like peptidoglycan-associated protein